MGFPADVKERANSTMFHWAPCGSGKEEMALKEGFGLASSNRGSLF